MKEWQTDKELFQLIKSELYTPVVADILDMMGCYHQMLPPEIRPLLAAHRVIGRAMPVLMSDVYGPQKQPFGKLPEALDQLLENEIYVANGGTMRCAYWGEILTASAIRNGATGAVINGYHRDTPQVLEQNWPVFSRGGYAQDSSVRTKVVEYRVPIEVGEVWIEPGDLVFGDLDGVIAIPKKYEIEVIIKALEKARSEKIVRKDIEQGMTTTEAFRKYGIL